MGVIGMNLREILRNDFSDYIRNKLIKEECEFCGSTKDLNFHHIDRFHNSLMETLDELKLQELNTEEYDSFELECIRNFMLAKQIKSEYKTLCKECHMKLHGKEKKSEVYKENYYNPFGGYIFINDENILKSNIQYDMFFRFLYLCTYMNYDGYIIDSTQKVKKKIKYDDINNILGFKRTMFYKIMGYLIDKNFIKITKDKFVIINKAFATKGFNNYKNRIKIFQNEFKKLYSSTYIKKHKKSGQLLYLFLKLKEQKFTKSIKDLSHRLGVNCINTTNLKKDINDVEINIMKSKNKINMFNPAIIYRGGLSGELKRSLEEFITL